MYDPEDPEVSRGVVTVRSVSGEWKGVYRHTVASGRYDIEDRHFIWVSNYIGRNLLRRSMIWIQQIRFPCGRPSNSRIVGNGEVSSGFDFGLLLP